MSQLDISDYYMIHALDDRNDVRSRARNIQDNFGIKAQDLESFRKEHGGFGIGKAILYTALGTGAGLLASAIIGPVGVMTGFAVGGIAGQVSMAFKNEKVMKEYNTYLDGVAAEGRMIRDGGRKPQTVEYEDNVRNRPGTFVGDIGSRAAPLQRG